MSNSEYTIINDNDNFESTYHNTQPTIESINYLYHIELFLILIFLMVVCIIIKNLIAMIYHVIFGHTKVKH